MDGRRPAVIAIVIVDEIVPGQLSGMALPSDAGIVKMAGAAMKATATHA